MSRTRRTAVLALAVISASAFFVSAPPPPTEPRKPSVIGGQQIPIESRPVPGLPRRGHATPRAAARCSTPRRVLTAAHCVVPVGHDDAAAGGRHPRATPATPTRTVATPPAGSQIVGVASLRVHPLYDEPTKTDDVAVLTLATPLNLAGAKIKPIALAPVGGGPPPGTAARHLRLRHADRGADARRQALRRER